MERARTVVNTCECSDGCKQCEYETKAQFLVSNEGEIGTQSATCKDANLLSSKAGAIIILNSLFNIPYGPDTKTQLDMGATVT